MAAQIEDGKAIKILLVDRCTLAGELLGPVLSRFNIKIIDQAFTCEEVLQKIREHLPGAVLLNEAMDSAESDKLCRRILDLYPQIKVFTYHWLDAWKWFASQQGAQIVMRLTTIEEMVWVIRAIVQELFYPCFPNHLLTSSSRVYPRNNKLRASGLNDTQISILKLVAKGHSNREIAQHLSLQVQTIKNNLNIIFQELCVQNRTEAVMVALQRGIILWQDVFSESEAFGSRDDDMHRTARYALSSH
ncbi:MAG: response regulator transcription factor [Chloroflexi bacterium]|nr:response regulator transcription factor [Chloroflexota bacterium]